MASISKSSSVPYTAQQMYDLVNDIESYPEYLQWCSEAHIDVPGVKQLNASLTLQAGKIKQTFSTHNTMVPGQEINIRLLKGPFKHLNGKWQFTDQDNDCCLITFNMDFEYKNRIVKMALSSVFNKIVDTMVDSFTQRAHELYGR